MNDRVTRTRESDTTSRVTVLETQMLAVAQHVERLDQRVEGQYQTLHSRISDMRNDLRDEIDKKHDDMMGALKEHMAAEAQHHETIQDKMQSIEKWRWMIMGGAIVLGYVLAHVKIDQLF